MLAIARGIGNEVFCLMLSRAPHTSSLLTLATAAPRLSLPSHLRALRTSQARTALQNDYGAQQAAWVNAMAALAPHERAAGLEMMALSHEQINAWTQ